MRFPTAGSRLLVLLLATVGVAAVLYRACGPVDSGSVSVGDSGASVAAGSDAAGSDAAVATADAPADAIAAGANGFEPSRVSAEASAAPRFTGAYGAIVEDEESDEAEELAAVVSFAAARDVRRVDGHDCVAMQVGARTFLCPNGECVALPFEAALDRATCEETVRVHVARPGADVLERWELQADRTTLRRHGTEVRDPIEVEPAMPRSTRRGPPGGVPVWPRGEGRALVAVRDEAADTIASGLSGRVELTTHEVSDGRFIIASRCPLEAFDCMTCFGLSRADGYLPGACAITGATNDAPFVRGALALDTLFAAWRPSALMVEIWSFGATYGQTSHLEGWVLVPRAGALDVHVVALGGSFSNAETEPSARAHWPLVRSTEACYRSIEVEGPARIILRNARGWSYTYNYDTRRRVVRAETEPCDDDEHLCFDATEGFIACDS